MAREFGPQDEEIMTRRQAEGLVRSGLWDPDGMDPKVDHVFDPGVIGLIRRRGSLHLVTKGARTLQEVHDASRILALDESLGLNRPNNSEASVLT